MKHPAGHSVSVFTKDYKSSFKDYIFQLSSMFSTILRSNLGDFYELNHKLFNNFHIHTMHLDIIKVSFMYQLMYKRTALKQILKFTLK
jgi:hypothetical protein